MGNPFMKYIPSSIPAVLAVAAIAGWFTPAASAWSVFTNGADFTNAISSSHFTETFDGLPENDFIPSPQGFAGNGFSFDAVSANYDGNDDALFSVSNTSVESGITVTYYGDDSLVFTNFNAGVSAIGGNFFAGNINDLEFEARPITLTVLLADSHIVSTNITPSSPAAFFGFVFDSNIRSLTISANGAAYPTAGSVTVGLNRNTNPIVILDDGKLFYSFVGASDPKPFSDVVTTTNLMLSNSWTTNGVTVLPPVEVSPGLTRYQFETSATNNTQRFMRALPLP